MRLDEDWLARLDAIKTLASIIVITLTVLMLGAVFLIVGNDDLELTCIGKAALHHR